LLLYSSNVLAYQMPILIMQDILGPITVVTFSITRTIYSLSRKIITMVTNALAPEITITFGQKNWAKLLRMYVLSERIILLMTIPVVCGSMLATPLLLRIWLHKGNLYRPGVCMLLGLTVAVLTLKEHKYQFQFSSNQVREISYMTLIAYSAMVLVSIPVMWRFGLVGYLITWFFTEVCQLFYLLRLNARLFQQGARIDRTPVYQFFAFLGFSFAIFYWPVFHIASITYLVQGTIAVTATVALLAVSYWIFQVDEVRSILWQKLAMRFPALASWGS
jgi:O-antigen/teichoic acid export membrane protein